MSSSFFGINVAQQGLYTAKANLDITNHNISNAETEGYSRQYAVQSASRPLNASSRGMVGTGSEITDVRQYRDEYLDYKFWNVSEKLGDYEVKTESLTQMELIFNEPSDVGFTSYFDNVFTSLSDLATNPGDSAAQSDFVSNLESFTAYLNDASNQFVELQKEANFGVKSSVEQINSLSEQIAVVNEQIGNLELSGNTANDLRDTRMNLIDDLSKIVNIEVDFTTDVNGIEKCKINLGGQQLVNDSVSYGLEAVEKEYVSNPEDYVDMYDIYWESGKKLYIDGDTLSGELNGYLEVRDGNNKDNFTGDITAGAGSSTITLENVSRHDIPEGGAVTIDGVEMEYDSYTYDDDTGVMVMTLNPAYTCPATSTEVSMGVAAAFKGVPYYEQQLNEFVRTIAMKFNELHQQGDSDTGIPLFTFEGYTGTPELDYDNPSTYDVITIQNIQVNPDIVDDVRLLETKYDAADGEGANDLLLDMINLRHDNDMFEKGEPDNFILALISELGIDINQIRSFQSSQEEMSSLVTNQRLSVSDVDLDEETVNLVKFQQAYNLSAKILTVFDEIYEVTINQMGV